MENEVGKSINSDMETCCCSHSNVLTLDHCHYSPTILVVLNPTKIRAPPKPWHP